MVRTAGDAGRQCALTSAAAASLLTLLPVAVAGFVRTITNPQIFDAPMPPVASAAPTGELLALPHVRLGSHGGEWARFAALWREHAPRGSLVTDVWVAASVRELNEHLVTCDRDLVRLLPPRHLTVLAR